MNEKLTPTISWSRMCCNFALSTLSGSVCLCFFNQQYSLKRYQTLAKVPGGVSVPLKFTNSGYNLKTVARPSGPRLSRKRVTFFTSSTWSWVAKKIWNWCCHSFHLFTSQGCILEQNIGEVDKRCIQSGSSEEMDISSFFKIKKVYLTASEKFVAKHWLLRFIILPIYINFSVIFLKPVHNNFGCSCWFLVSWDFILRLQILSKFI